MSHPVILQNGQKPLLDLRQQLQIMGSAQPPLWEQELEALKEYSLHWPWEQIIPPTDTEYQRRVVLCRIFARWGMTLKVKNLRNISTIAWETPSYALSLVSPLSATTIIRRKNGLDKLPAATIGSLSAKILLLGERTSGWEQWTGNFRRLPFVGLNQSSLFLTRLLKEAELNEAELHFGNAQDETGRDFPFYDFSKVITSVQTVVALGGFAKEILKKYDLPDEMRRVNYPHPSYVKRFYYHSMKEWAKKLRNEI